MQFIHRKLKDYLEDWKARDHRKPLILRGARQVGKTTLIEEFGTTYRQVLSINLEDPVQREVFETIDDINALVQRIFIDRGLRLDMTPTLVFIDEIQASVRAIGLLRFFYERYPGLHVIAAGSLLEHALQKVQSFPVGRVEYAILHPLNFEEFLFGMREDVLLEVFVQIPVPTYAHNRLLHLFHQYAIIGGMPEVTSQFAGHRDMTQLAPVYESIVTGYQDDAPKYARGPEEARRIMHCIDSAPIEAGKRVTFAGFGNSAYCSREIGEALRALEKSRLIRLIYPTVSTTPPARPDKRKSPRLQFVDTGLMNYALGIQGSMIGINDLNEFYKGTIIEHLVIQEYLSIHYQPSFQSAFWVRQKPTSTAETDLLITCDEFLIPVEIKSGSSGHLRSLNAFMDACPHHYAIRLYAGEFSIHPATTPLGKQFYLLNLPYYLGSRLNHIAEWFVREYPMHGESKSK